MSHTITIVLPRIGEVDLEYIGTRNAVMYYLEPRTQQVFTYLLEVGNFKLQGLHDEVMRALPPHLQPK